MKIKKFEDIEAWQKSRNIVNSIYKISNKSSFSRDFSLRDQIRRAAISIISNISEGFSRESTKEFIRFLFIAKSSASEVQSQLYIAKDQGYINENEFNEIYDRLDHCSRQISNLIKHLKSFEKK
jgi:four helix bundle protein